MHLRPSPEAVQGAGMVGPFQAQGAAESDASVRLRGRSHVPGTRSDRTQVDEAGVKKAKPCIGPLPYASGVYAFSGVWYDEGMN